MLRQLQFRMEPDSAPSIALEQRESVRERKLTPKMLELKQETCQKESKFIKLYEHWKEELKNERKENNLAHMMDAVEGLAS